MSLDPKLQGTPILRKTLCSVGTHTFTWGGNGGESSPFGLFCGCGMYTYKEWQGILRKP